MELKSYKNYQEYVDIQTRGNKAKIKCVWVNENNIKKLAKFIKEKKLKHNYILCHGTRNGKELEYFTKYLSPSQIIGTEISDTARKFKNTIQWDFHNVKPEWINHFDIIYSNSLDHSYKPMKCLTAWMSCLHDDGVLIIEWSRIGHFPNSANKLDPFGATFEKLIEIITNLQYHIMGCIICDDKKQSRIFIIQKTKPK